jgi:LacI family transcriptional regulator
MDQITIKDIAKALGLSNSTVSRALKSSYQISEATQKLVKDYAEKHHYRPNVLAQSLKSKKSKSIGVLFPTVSNNFFGEVMNGIESIANNCNYQVIISQSHESSEQELERLKHLLLRSVDGLLISLSTETLDISYLNSLLEQDFPIVFFDRVVNQVNTHKVVSANADGAYDATMHMLNNGYKRIAQITSSANISITTERLEGYYKALEKSDIAINTDYVKYCAHGGMKDDEVENAVQELMALKDPPDALITASDRLTIKTFAWLKNNGYDIPGQIGLAGFSNFSSPELFQPSLTTIKQPAFEMGKTAVELLIQQIESKKPTTEFLRKVLPTELMVRGSTAGKTKK